MVPRVTLVLCPAPALFPILVALLKQGKGQKRLDQAQGWAGTPPYQVCGTSRVTAPRQLQRSVPGQLCKVPLAGAALTCSGCHLLDVSAALTYPLPGAWASF